MSSRRSIDIQDDENPNELVSNGRVDLYGRIANKQTTGGWKSAPFIVVNEVAERLAFYATAVNMVAYLVTQMHESIPDAVTITMNWIGAAYVLTVLGAFLADAYLGRFKTILIFSIVYSVGMILITFSAAVDSLRPPKCTIKPCKAATQSQSAFLYLALTFIAFGTGGIKPCVSSFGADQFDEGDGKEVQKKFSFFNWFFFAINMGALIGITVMVYIQTVVGWGWGFGVPAASMIFSVLVLVSGVKYYRYQTPMGSPFTRFMQVIVSSVRNHIKGVKISNDVTLFEVETKQSDIAGARKLHHTQQYRFFDKAAVMEYAEDRSNRWQLCTVTQVEEFKCFVRVLPVWLFTIALAVSFAQMGTFFVTQANIMDLNLGKSFKIPAGSVPALGTISAVIIVPVYERLVVPILRKHTGHHRGLTSLQRMGVGLFLSIIAMASAAIVEKKRRDQSHLGLMSVFWLLPQYFLMSAAEVFTYVGQLEFFYDEATDGTRSISSATFLVEFGIGSWISTSLVKIVRSASGGLEKGWLRNDLNMSKLDYFYWILTAYNFLNFFPFLIAAYCYKGKGAYVTDEDEGKSMLNSQ